MRRDVDMAGVRRRVTTEGLVRSVMGAAACLVLGYYAFVRNEPVPLLRVIDVGSHELGRFIALPLPKTFDLMAGSIAQVLVPAGFAAYFLFAATYSQIITAAAALLLLVAIGTCLATPLLAARRRSLIFSH